MNLVGFQTCTFAMKEGLLLREMNSIMCCKVLSFTTVSGKKEKTKNPPGCPTQKIIM